MPRAPPAGFLLPQHPSAHVRVWEGPLLRKTDAAHQFRIARV
jgi:hypothetical protein